MDAPGNRFHVSLAPGQTAIIAHVHETQVRHGESFGIVRGRGQAQHIARPVPIDIAAIAQPTGGDVLVALDQEYRLLGLAAVNRLQDRWFPVHVPAQIHRVDVVARHGHEVVARIVSRGAPTPGNGPSGELPTPR